MSGRDESSCFESKRFVFLRKLLGSVLETVPTTPLFETREEGLNLYGFVMPQLDQWFDDLDDAFSDVSDWGTGEFDKLLKDFEVEGEFEFVHVFLEFFLFFGWFFCDGSVFVFLEFGLFFICCVLKMLLLFFVMIYLIFHFFVCFESGTYLNGTHQKRKLMLKREDRRRSDAGGVMKSEEICFTKLFAVDLTKKGLIFFFNFFFLCFGLILCLQFLLVC